MKLMKQIFGSLSQSPDDATFKYNLQRANNMLMDLIHGPGGGGELRFELPKRPRQAKGYESTTPRLGRLNNAAADRDSGMGVVEFPDGMSDDQITTAIKANKPKQSFGEFAKETFETAPATSWMGMARGAKDTLRRGGKMFSGEIDPTSDEGIKTATEGALLATPLPPGMRGTPGFRPQMVEKRVEPPTASALSETGGAQYNAVREADPLYRQDAVKGSATVSEREFESAGIYADRAPEAFKHLPKFDQAPPGAVSTFDNLHHARRHSKTSPSTQTPYRVTVRLQRRSLKQLMTSWKSLLR